MNRGEAQSGLAQQSPKLPSVGSNPPAKFMKHGKYRIYHPAIYKVVCPTCGAGLSIPCHVTVKDGSQVGKAIRIHKTRIQRADNLKDPTEDLINDFNNDQDDWSPNERG